MDYLQIKEKNLLTALQGYDKLGVFSVDTNLVCTSWNLGMETISGINEKDILAQNILKKFPDLIDSQHLHYIKSAFRNEKNYVESVSFFPFSKITEENFTLSYLPVLNESTIPEACLIIVTFKEENSELKQNLEKIQSRYKSLTENSGTGIWQINADGITEYVNPAMCTILGINKKEEIIGKHFHSFFTEESLKKMETEHKKRSQNIKSTYETELINVNGEIRNIIINGSPLLSKEGKLEGMIGTFIDITDKKISEKELKKSEERFRFLFEKTTAPTGISRHGNLLLVNEAFVNLFKFESSKELISTSVLNLIIDSERAEASENIRKRIAGLPAPFHFELTGLKKDGTEFPFHLTISDIELSDGKATVVSIKDMSQEMALRASESKFRGLFNSNMIGITFSNAEKIFEANDKFMEIIQYTQEDILHNRINWTVITPPEYFEKDQNAIKEYIEKGFIAPYEKEFIRKDGTRIPVLIAAAALEGNIRMGVGFTIDLSDLKQSKEETSKVSNELSTFLYMASHDLKGPLASVIGLGNIAHNDIEDPKALEYIKLIQECTLKLDRSLMNFLKIIKIKNNVLDHLTIDFNGIVNEILSSLMHQSSFSNAEFVLSNNLQTEFYSDPDLIKSIIQNLVENSIKYQTRLRKPIIKIIIEDTEKFISIRVDDNGRGIDEKIKDKIFNIFYRGDIASKGSGLGLYIVKSAAEKLGGSVLVENKTAGGSVFTINLPKTISNN